MIGCIHILSVHIISGNVVQIHPCQVSAEMDGTNHKTSHDGMFKAYLLLIIDHEYIYNYSFKVKAVNVKQEYLDQIGGIKVTLSGTSITKFQKKNWTGIEIQV